MKRYLFLLSVLSLFSFMSCLRVELAMPEEDTINVQMGLTLDGISISDEPLTKSETKHPYYAVYVDEFNPNTSKYEGYATGIFDNLSKMTITLNKSKKYNISIALLYDYIENGYSFGRSITNSFNYTDPYPPKEIHGGYSTPFDYGSKSAIFCDSYYGFLTEYKPSSTCTVELKRITTALKVVVNAVTNGTIRMLYEPGFSINLAETNEMTFEFSTIEMVKIYDHVIYDSARIPFGLEYIDSDNKKTTLTIGYEVFKRGYRKNIIVNIEADNGASSSAISLSIEPLEFTDEEVKIINTQL